MQNIFPGIDPFVEASGDWPDFHSTFMNAWREAIADRLPDEYIARLEERLTVVEFEETRERRSAPDISISKIWQSDSPREQTHSLATLEPETVRVTIEEESRQTYIEILHHADHKLVAVLELLSPANKVGVGRSQYLAKRQAILLSDVHLVELDLLITGKRMPTEKPLPVGNFHALVSRAESRPVADVFSWSLNRELPPLPVPLAEPDPDIVIDMANVLATTYKRGRYYKTVKYHAPLELPLSEDELAWVKERLARAAN